MFNTIICYICHFLLEFENDVIFATEKGFIDMRYDYSVRNIEMYVVVVVVSLFLSFRLCLLMITYYQQHLPQIIALLTFKQTRIHVIP